MIIRFLFRMNNKRFWFLLLLCSIIIFFKSNNILISNSSVMPILSWWTPFFPNTDRIIECDSNIKCLITNKRNYNADMFLFYGSLINNTNLPLPKNVTWALFHEESPKNYAPLLFSDAQELFELTSTFSRYSDFPVPLQYLSKKEFKLLTSKKYYKSVQEKNQLLKKISPVLYVQSDCDTPIDRDHLVKELSKYIQIDSYGICLRNKTFPENLKTVDALDLYNEEYLEFLSQYKFIIAYENANCNDYITEKFWRSLVVGSVPIYLGAPTIEDWLPNPNSAILVKNYKNPKTLAKFINEVNNNDVLYESFLEHKIFGTISNNFLKKWILQDHPLSVFECFVCKRFHSGIQTATRQETNIYDCPKPKNRKGNTWEQHWDIGQCQAKALKEAVKNGKQLTVEQFGELWRKFYYSKLC